RHRGGHAALGLREHRRRGALGQRERGARAVGGGLGGGQLGPRDLDARRVVGGVALDEHVARRDALVVDHAHVYHLARHARRHAHHPAFDLGVVGRLLAAVHERPAAPPRGRARGEGRDHARRARLGLDDLRGGGERRIGGGRYIIYIIFQS